MKMQDIFITIIGNILFLLVGVFCSFCFIVSIFQGLKYLQMGKYPIFEDFLFLFFYGFTSYWCFKRAFTRIKKIE